MPDACVYCGTTGVTFHLDHVVPRSRGGPDHPRNIVEADDWDGAPLRKLIDILRQCSKVEPDEDPPFVRSEDTRPDMVDD